MRKLRIDIGQLKVESFDVVDSPVRIGTVYARELETFPGECPPTGDAYCSFGPGCTYPLFTCGGMQCQTYEAEVCWPETDRGPSCHSVC